MTVFRLGISESVARSMRKRKLKKEQVLFTAGEPAQCIYRVIEGSVRMVVVPNDGKPLVLFRAQAGETFGEEHLIYPTCQYSAVATEETVVASIERSLMVRELRAKPEGYGLLFEGLCQRFKQVSTNFQRIAIPDAKTRVLDLLRRLALSPSAHGNVIELHGKIKGYAADLNLSHEAVYRALNRLEIEGRIQRMADGSVKVT